MKKVLSIILAPVLSMALLTGCGSSSENKNTNNTSNSETKTTTETKTAEGSIAKIGLGHITSIAKSKDLTDGVATGQVDTVMAAVGFDKDNKVVKITIDTAQTAVKFDQDMKLTSDVNAEYKTKLELGDNYGLKAKSGIGKEWYEQIAALEDWMKGKTVEEIKAVNTAEDADLKTSVTVSVDDYVKAVEEAFANAVAVDGAEKLGLGNDISIAKSKSAEGENGAVAQVDTVMMVTAFDKDGKVAGAILDTAQTKVQFDKDGKVTTDKNGEFKTKVELGDNYGMKKASSIGKEWYEQAAAFTSWMKGKKVDEIKAVNAAEDADLKASVTVSVDTYLKTLEEASNKAK
ncbi:MAG: hypothetical protein GX895_08025 [Clostridiales bacterium]|uniref:hypothetical protein n=1 Tax=Clostridium sp. N3C TaxID=1776758 RepID=UPI00092DF152|nr:hypothetical protein [Clostridium sp. N3C]NLZ48722.1 hypothetical protein [Clostridiales bacterium]SCN21255.1 Ortho-chlorophenol reductive dehalogenase [Clostridium sp. N3C]